MTNRRYHLAAVLILAASMPFTGCKNAEPPAPVASAPTEKPSTPAPEAPACRDCTPVTADNFNRAETDMYFAEPVQQAGSIGKFYHFREIMSIDKQAVIRANRDTLYSAALFDLDAGPVTITLPNAGKRFMSLIVIDEDQYVPAVYHGAGSYTLT